MNEKSRSSQVDASTLAQEARGRLQKQVGERVAAIRKQRGMRKAACAAAAAMDVSSLWRVETGALNLTLEVLAKLALALDVGIEQLVSGVQPDPAILERRPKPAFAAGTKVKAPSRRRAPAAAAPEER